MSGDVPPIEILFLTHNYPRFAGDFAGAFLARLAEKVSATGRPVGVLAPHYREAPLNETVNGVQIWRFRYASDARETLAYQGDLGKLRIAGRRGLLAHARFMQAFRRDARAVAARESPRTIHAHWWIPAGLIARQLRFSGNLVVTLHGTDLRLLRDRRWLRPLARRVFARASVVTVVSSWLGSALRELYPEIASKLQVTPMPPNDDVFFHDRSQPPPKDVPLLVSVTRFTAQKRNRVFVQALALLRDLEIVCNTRLIGDGPLRTEVIQLVRSLGLEDRVTFQDPMSQAALAAQYREADVVVLPAVDEGFGMALVEAQLCGTAVAGVRSGGLCDIIDDGSTGVLVQPDDAADLARALTQLLSDGALRARLADAGYRAATQRFSSAAIVSSFCRWYDSG